jgi:hypothetical protein
MTPSLVKVSVAPVMLMDVSVCELITSGVDGGDYAVYTLRQSCTQAPHSGASSLGTSSVDKSRFQTTV